MLDRGGATALLALPRESRPGTPAEALLEEARTHEREGRFDEAIAGFGRVIATADASGDVTVLAEALRRLGVLCHLRGESEEARRLAQRSFEAASRAGQPVPAAEALNTLACFQMDAGAYDPARELFHRALELGGTSAPLRGRIQQNLGILANLRGDLGEALAHYELSLSAFRTAKDERGCALAYHNLGIISADRFLWDDAERYFRSSLAIAERIGDVHLRGLCLLNHTEVHLARRQFDQARRNAESALQIFDGLGDAFGKSAAYRFLGIYYRETRSPQLAEARLRAAIQLAAHDSPHEEAEASRELARLFQDLGRNQEALALLNQASRLFQRIDARAAAVDVRAKMQELEETYFAVVRDWGQSLESADSYTFGHCERVAEYAVAVAQALGLEAVEQKTIRFGAYLHDIGKVRVPHEVLNKPGALSGEEFALLKQHPAWGVEMLAAVEFPWDIKPIIRWHHEKYDGSGYPDRLKGDEIPVAAQIICIADVYDALTTARSYKAPLPPEVALQEMATVRRWWRPDVYEAFMRTVGGR